MLYNILCFPPNILHKHRFPSFLGFTMVPREIIENNAYVKFWMENKEYYGIFKVAYKVEGTIVDK